MADAASTCGYEIPTIPGSANAANAAQEEEFALARAAEGGVDGVDAPILAALGSHRAALAEVEASTSKLEDGAARWGPEPA